MNEDFLGSAITGPSRFFRCWSRILLIFFMSGVMRHVKRWSADFSISEKSGKCVIS